MNERRVLKKLTNERRVLEKLTNERRIIRVVTNERLVLLGCDEAIVPGRLQAGHVPSEELWSLGVTAEVLAALQQTQDGGSLVLELAQHLDLSLNQALDGILANEKRVLRALTNEKRVLYLTVRELFNKAGLVDLVQNSHNLKIAKKINHI